jgi:uncharacterized RDD family membrane protein YckC
MSSLDAGYSTDTTSTLTKARAGFWRRFAAAFIDGIVVSVISGILRLLLDNVGEALSVLVGFAYYTYFHGSTGQTPGDAALSIRVVDLDGGGPIGYGRAFVRCLVSIVSALVFFLGYLWMIWDRPEKQCWHDKAANCVVIPTRE